MNRKSEELKEKQISEIMASIENRVRHAYNQGFEQGLKASKQETCEQIKWERDTAIKQLNELGYALGEKIEPCEDAISRQAVRVSAYECMIEAVESEYLYPSVQPRPKTGHWIEEDMFDGDVAYRCSECEELFWIECGTPKDNDYKYCPNCGAKMESEDKE